MAQALFSNETDSRVAEARTSQARWIISFCSRLFVRRNVPAVGSARLKDQAA